MHHLGRIRDKDTAGAFRFPAGRPSFPTLAVPPEAALRLS